MVIVELPPLEIFFPILQRPFCQVRAVSNKFSQCSGEIIEGSQTTCQIYDFNRSICIKNEGKRGIYSTLMGKTTKVTKVTHIFKSDSNFIIPAQAKIVEGC